MTPEEVREQVVAQLPDAPIVVALGGGADSAVAAWACAQRPATRGVFVDHGLEGSATLLAAAVKLAEVVELPITILLGPIDDGPNLESRARDVRWRAIRQDVAPDEMVVTGHSRDDRVETLLINLLRGGGSGGLGAMSARRGGIVRPLLGYDRAELRALAEDLGLPFADDPANERRDLLRNHIRIELIPLLEQDFQEGVRTTLSRSAGLLAADDTALESEAARIDVRRDDGALLLPIPMLLTAPRPVAARAVRRALREINPPYAGRSADVAAVMSVAASERETATLSSGLTASREGPYVAVWGEEQMVPDPTHLPVPGSVRFGDRLITATTTSSGIPRPRSIALIEPGVLARGVMVRGAGTGDRIDIDEGSKLLRDALAEAGVPARKRAAWPVLANDARIVAIVAGRVAPWARPTGEHAVAVTQERM